MTMQLEVHQVVRYHLDLIWSYQIDNGMSIVLRKSSGEYCRHHLEFCLSLIKNAVHFAVIVFKFLTYRFCVLLNSLDPIVLLPH